MKKNQLFSRLCQSLKLPCLPDSVLPTHQGKSLLAVHQVTRSLKKYKATSSNLYRIRKTTYTYLEVQKNPLMCSIRFFFFYFATEID